MAYVEPEDAPAEVLIEAARMLRELVKAAPAVNAVERRLARRIEGAAAALEAVASYRKDA